MKPESEKRDEEKSLHEYEAHDPYSSAASLAFWWKNFDRMADRMCRSLAGTIEHGYIHKGCDKCWDAVADRYW